MKIVSILLPIIFIIAVLFLLFAPHTNKNTILLDLTKVQNAHNAAQSLEDNNLIYNKYFFLAVLKALWLEKKIIAGEFEIKPHTSLFSLIKIITSTKNLYYYKITIIEGWSVKEALNHINKNPNLEGIITIKIPEGSLMPDTYVFSKGYSRNDLIKSMQKDMKEYLDKLWENRNKKLPYKTKEEALTLASIVEKETSFKDERALIAGVFLNRLRLGIKLQTDPTVAYGLGKLNADKLTKADLQSNTPYNTYIIKALPPTPIANPSRKSLQAVFNPQQSSYLYFVADGNGGHAFATNLKDHNANVEKWRVVEKGIRKAQKEASLKNKGK
jgi:UPF0755 protein